MRKSNLPGTARAEKVSVLLEFAASEEGEGVRGAVLFAERREKRWAVWRG